MNTIKRNLAANMIGTAWNSALSLLFIPVYLRLLGVEAYGLIGFYAVLLTIFGLLDLGLGATLNRTIARLSAMPDSRAAQGDLLRTFEVIYLAVAFGAAAVLFACAPVVAHHWIHVHQLSVSQVTSAIRMMAVLTAFQFPLSLYLSGLIGLQRHVLLNAINIVSSTLRAAGVVLVLMFVSRTIVAFFAWQVIVMAAQTATMAWATWHNVGRVRTARFDRRILRAEWHFAASVAANSVIALFITQADKAILSTMAPLQDLGYYTVAATLSGGLLSIIVPINTAVYPRFSQLLALNDERSVADVFHKACQTVALVVLPIAVTLAVFAQPIVLIWTGNAIAADQAALITPLLVTGTALYGLASVPIYLQFAIGWPQLTLYTNIIAAAILIPLTFHAVRVFGAPGAALVWFGVNAAYFVPAMIMFRRVIVTERRRWVLRDLGVPTIAAAAVGGLFRRLQPAGMDRMATIAYICAASAAVFTAVFIVTPDVRRIVIMRLRTLVAPYATAGADFL